MSSRASSMHDVRDFHRKFGFPAPQKLTKLTEEVRDQRLRLLREELAELEAALMGGELHEIAHEAIDLIYVSFGTLVCCGIMNFRDLFKVVHQANMAKLVGGEKPIKPWGWQKPSIKAILADWEAGDHGQFKKGGGRCK